MKFKLEGEIFELISEIITKEKREAYVIGGYVRDYILKRNSKDIDIVTIGSGIDLAQKVAEKIGCEAKLSIFKNFGTANIKYKDIEIEFVGARKESYLRNSRKPIVEDGTLKDDLERRDFTINSLGLSLHKTNFGELIDAFDGIKDINDRIIRTPLEPAKTFSDDPLRMMRAIRFSTQLNFTIEQNTYQAISENKERIGIISKERIISELEKILLSFTPSVGFKMLDETGLLELIFPELYKLKGVDFKNGMAHKDIFLHSLKVLDNISNNTNDIWLRWAALLHDIGKPITKKFSEQNGWTFYAHDFIGARMIPDIFKRMKLPLNEKMKYVQKLIELHLRPIVLSDEEVTDSAIRRLLFDAGEEVEDLMTLCEADITSANDDKVKSFLNNFRIVRQKLKEIEEKDAVRNFQPPISGDEIIKIFNIQPGRIVGIIKTAIKDAILDGKIKNNREEAYQFMLEEAVRNGLTKSNL